MDWKWRRMGAVQRMRYCELCDVYVGVAATGEMVVVASAFFYCCRAGHATWNDPDFEQVWGPDQWLRGAGDEGNAFVWFEHEGAECLWWYQARGLEVLHDHVSWFHLDVS